MKTSQKAKVATAVERIAKHLSDVNHTFYLEYFTKEERESVIRELKKVYGKTYRIENIGNMIDMVKHDKKK